MVFQITNPALESKTLDLDQKKQYFKLKIFEIPSFSKEISGISKKGMVSLVFKYALCASLSTSFRR